MCGPERIQLKRSAGFVLKHESQRLNGRNCINVSRSGIGRGKYGNPFKVGETYAHKTIAIKTNHDAVDYFKSHRYLMDPEYPSIEQIKEELAEHNLACFCGPDEACHADVLLEIVNG